MACQTNAFMSDTLYNRWDSNRYPAECITRAQSKTWFQRYGAERIATRIEDAQMVDWPTLQDIPAGQVSSE